MEKFEFFGEYYNGKNWTITWYFDKKEIYKLKNGKGSVKETKKKVGI